MIDVLHITEDHSVKNTGVTSSLKQLVSSQSSEIRSHIITVGIEDCKDNQVECLKLPWTTIPWRYAIGQGYKLRKIINQNDIVHIHGVWMWIQLSSARLAIKQNKPVILSTHGMLEPWLWSGQGIIKYYKKRLYWQVLASKIFSYVNIIHALNETEANNLRKYFDQKKIRIIPNGIDFTRVDSILNKISITITDQDPYLLFIGRIHPKKGIHLLINAFAKMKSKDFRLIIVGPIDDSQRAYFEHLQQLIEKHDLKNKVVFHGLVTGIDKWKLIKGAWSLCLPSISEGLAMVTIESAASYTPIVASYACGISPKVKDFGGILIDPEESEMINALDTACNWSLDERKTRGEKIRDFVSSNYNANLLKDRWLSLYDTLIG